MRHRRRRPSPPIPSAARPAALTGLLASCRTRPRTTRNNSEPLVAHPRDAADGGGLSGEAPCAGCGPRATKGEVFSNRLGEGNKRITAWARGGEGTGDPASPMPPSFASVLSTPMPQPFSGTPALSYYVLFTAHFVFVMSTPLRTSSMPSPSCPLSSTRLRTGCMFTVGFLDP